MAGKSKEQKKKRAKVQRRLDNEQRQANNKIKAEREAEAEKITLGNNLGNNAEPKPAEINEDVWKDAAVGASIPENFVGKEKTKIKGGYVGGVSGVGTDKLEEPFDPKKLIADLLEKKKDE